MKQWLITLGDGDNQPNESVGAKFRALSKMANHGFQVPRGICITSEAYTDFTNHTGLDKKIMLEINRKPFKDMRWEEVWDSALRIRNMFLKAPMSKEMAAEFRSLIEQNFKDATVAVRSTAPGEDSHGSSFAGIHASYINVCGIDEIISKIRLVWASLWSDTALMYRKELKIDPLTSRMAVIVQDMIDGDVSGVAFSVDPTRSTRGVIEAVYGLNQGLVDGEIEPDRWFFNRDSFDLQEHTPAVRKRYMVPGPNGGKVTALSDAKRDIPPLLPNRCREIAETVMQLEAFFGAPQDMEWTVTNDRLFLLQSRPITTINTQTGDKRSWYVSLKRSFDNLKTLRCKIESESIPAMIRVALDLSEQDLTLLTDNDLADAIKKRFEISAKWSTVYWNDFIPFAHGVRLFGEVYNEKIRPDDPYEFVALLRNTGMISVERNRRLLMLARLIHDHPELETLLRGSTHASLPGFFETPLNDFIQKYGDLTCSVTGATDCAEETGGLMRLLLQMAKNLSELSEKENTIDLRAMKQRFFDAFAPNERRDAEEILDLGRASYRLRDDDNIHLGRIESQFIAALQEADKRILAAQGDLPFLSTIVAEMGKGIQSDSAGGNGGRLPMLKSKARQRVGQPAGPGIAKGRARVITKPSDLTHIEQGEIIVCDAVDPNMTFAVPLSAGIVERRGGMLIHGAIIAREYGLPCVTGLTDILDWIKTGDMITVDGYLGIVTME